MENLRGNLKSLKLLKQNGNLPTTTVEYIGKPALPVIIMKDIIKKHFHAVLH